MTSLPSSANHIRPARPDDLDAIEALEASFPEDDRVSRANLRRQLASPSVTCLVSEGQSIEGAAVLLFRRGAETARLYSISVSPNAFGKGIGRALIDACKRIARERGCQRMRLEVRASNQRAISLYERSGFCVIGKKPAYYDDGEDALQMEHSLCHGSPEFHE